MTSPKVCAQKADTDNGSPVLGDNEPEQRHAGAARYGPEYGKGAGTNNKFQGLFEEANSKLLHKPDIAQHGYDLRTGVLKRKGAGRRGGSVPEGRRRGGAGRCWRERQRGSEDGERLEDVNVSKMHQRTAQSPSVEDAVHPTTT